jgi:hypothetical protein
MSNTKRTQFNSFGIQTFLVFLQHKTTREKFNTKKNLTNGMEIIFISHLMKLLLSFYS